MFPQVSKIGDGCSIIPSVVALPEEERLATDESSRLIWREFDPEEAGVGG